MNKLAKGLAFTFTAAAAAAGVYAYGPERTLKGAQDVAKYVIRITEDTAAKLSADPAPAPVKAPPPAPTATQAPEAPKAEAAPRALYGSYENVEVRTNDKFTVKGDFIAVMNPEAFADSKAPKMSQDDFDAIVKTAREKGAARYRLTVYDAHSVLEKEAARLVKDPEATPPAELTFSVTQAVKTGIEKEIANELKARGYALAEKPEKPPIAVMFRDHKVTASLTGPELLKAAGMERKAAAKSAPKLRR